MDSSYTPPTALTVLSGIFLAIGALCFLIVTIDIVWRKGWKSMMGVMIPVYPINAAYLGPLTLYIYFKYGRPTKPVRGQASTKPCHTAASPSEDNKDKDTSSISDTASTPSDEKAPSNCCASSKKEASAPPQKPISCHPPAEPPAPTKSCCHSSSPAAPKPTPSAPKPCCHSSGAPSSDPEKASTPHCHSAAETRPYLATVLVGVSHCGAGCVLGDLVGEWLVYGTDATISGQTIWPCLLIDYAFALVFGIMFQYFSIAPMSGEYGPKTVWRAAKADILSLTSFEIGAFGWMIIYQVGIFGYKLDMMTWTYWWMMQIGMCMGFATGVPANWFLLKWKIKEPCC